MRQGRDDRLRCLLASFTTVILACALAAPGVSYAAPEGPADLGTLTAAPLSAPLGQARSGRKPATKGISLRPSATEARWACPEESCEAIVDPAPDVVEVNGRKRFKLPAGGPLLEGGGEKGGLDPQDLQSAYKIPTSGGEGETIALVDAFGYAQAEEDLAVYRARYGLPPCTKANGCFSKVNQKGEEGNYPVAKEGWETESALDLDMASAACPHCHILLAEAKTAGGTNLPEAVDTAARLGATVISNSYGSLEQFCGSEGNNCEAEAAAYDHPGIMIFAGGGDSGYDGEAESGHSAFFPASLPSVIAVGGTVLRKATNARGWSEKAWSRTGSGCAALWPKPIWQTDTACTTRMANDVAAVGACESPLSTYDAAHGAWSDVCGTSASTPLVAGIEAHASAYARSLPGADAFYQDTEGLFDVTEGSNGKCTPPEADAYFCKAGVGYDGPTGLGAPDGPLELSSAPSPVTRTTAASGVVEGTGTLNGEINPQGIEASYHFEYGTSTEYGTSIPVPDAPAGSDRTAVPVSQDVTGLTAGAVYHYRLVASNANGTSYGADSVFSTTPPVVTGVSPDAGPTDGTNTVTITGTSLQSPVAVNFGSRPAERYTPLSEDSISAIIPQGAGIQDVTVTTPAGTSAAVSADRYSYDTVGPVLAWGVNEERLGDLSYNPFSNVPVEVNELPEPASLAAGYDASSAVLKDGAVEAWGIGLIGNGTFYGSSDTPVSVCAVEKVGCPEGPYLEGASAVSAGAYHTLALMRDGSVVAWGADGRGQLGSGTDEDPLSTPLPVCTILESPCESEHYLREVKAISAGETFSLALLENGTVMAWGRNAEGELGLGKSKGPETCTPDVTDPVKEACSKIPVAVPGLSEVIAISAGGDHALALLRNGTVMSWGAGREGQLGDGSTEQSDSPTAVCAAGELAPCKALLKEVMAVSAGEHTSLAILKDGAVLDWGSNVNGQLGDGSLTGPEECESLGCSRSPVKVEGLSKVSAAATGNAQTSSVAVADGEVMTWGGNKLGQLGDGLEAASATPVHVCQAFLFSPCPDGPYLAGEVGALAVGGQHVLIGIASSVTSVTALSPSTGPGRGGTRVTIAGTHLAGADAVHFGAVPATEFEVRSETEILAVAPPGTGAVDVTVSGPEGTSRHSPADQFSYEGSTVTGLSPANGPSAGGTRVTIAGSKLTEASAVHFGANAASEVEGRSATEVVALAPPGSGRVDVTVTTPEGTSAANPSDEYSYEGPPVVLTQPASTVRLTTATLNATVNPQNLNVSECRFEWGANASYGASIPCAALPGAVGATVSVSASLSNLRPAQTVHFRIVARNTDGAGYGEDQTFTTPAAEPPELGRCMKLASKTGGGYTNSACTDRSTSDTGRYEWELGAGPSPQFSASTAGVTLQTISTKTGETLTDLTCTSGHLSGEYTGIQSATLSLVLSKCSGPFGLPCESERASEGVIEAAFDAQLGIISANKHTVGWDLQPASGTALLSYACTGEPHTVTASIIGTLGKADKMSDTFSLTFKTAKGAQVPEAFEHGPPQVPALNENAATLVMHATGSNSEKLELRAIP